MIFEQVLSLAKKYLFFQPVISKSGNHILNYEFGPSGALFLENIKTEWIYSNVTNRDTNVFLYNSKERGVKLHDEHYKAASDVSNKKLPFGIAEIFNISKKDDKTGTLSEGSYFDCLNSTQLSSTMYLPSEDSMQYFFYWQRQRKLWWKKISAFPGRFYLGDINSSSTNAFVNIYAKFSWGDQLLETISITPNDKSVLESQKKSKKDLPPSKICSEMSLENAVLGLFCDGLDDTSGPTNCVLRLHRKLTPHKCTFAAGGTDPAILEELAQLAFYLTKQFRKAGIQTMLLSDCTQIPLEDQFHRNDEWGIPYTIILDDVSLKQGIIKLRSRDTTLSEEVHLSDLTSYLRQLFKNF